VIAAARRLVARAHALPDRRVRAALHLLDAAATDAGDPAEEGAPHLTRVCRAVGVSRRTLERLFADHVGFAPRTYQRLRRAGAVAEALEREAPARRRGALMLTDLAHRFGYADHAHMTREFRRIMGVTPSAYRREALEAPLARQVAEPALERSTPFGVVGRRSAA
jgi:AraC-like DNA-binding protein